MKKAPASIVPPGPFKVAPISTCVLLPLARLRSWSRSGPWGGLPGLQLLLLLRMLLFQLLGLLLMALLHQLLFLRIVLLGGLPIFLFLCLLQFLMFLILLIGQLLLLLLQRRFGHGQ